FVNQRVIIVPVGGEAAPRVLEDHDVAVLDEDVDVTGTPALALVVRKPGEQHGATARRVRTVHVRAQDDAVARRHRNVPLDDHDAKSLLDGDGSPGLRSRHGGSPMSWNGETVIDLDSHIVERADRFSDSYIDPAY